MRSKLQTHPMVLAVAYALAMPLLLGALANWQRMPAILNALGGQTAAAWMQAVGSVAAIGGAWLLTRQQIIAQSRQLTRELRAQERRREQDLLALRSSVVAVMVNARARFVLALKAMQKNRPSSGYAFGVVASTCEGAETMMRAFPVHELADAEAISWFLEALGAVEVTIRHMRMLADPELNEIERGVIEGLESSIVTTANELELRMTLFSTRFGFPMPANSPPI